MRSNTIDTLIKDIFQYVIEGIVLRLKKALAYSVTSTQIRNVYAGVIFEYVFPAFTKTIYCTYLFFKKKGHPRIKNKNRLYYIRTQSRVKSRWIFDFVAFIRNEADAMLDFESIIDLILTMLLQKLVGTHIRRSYLNNLGLKEIKFNL